jgi:hypothetical protein
MSGGPAAGDRWDAQALHSDFTGIAKKGGL